MGMIKSFVLSVARLAAVIVAVVVVVGVLGWGVYTFKQARQAAKEAPLSKPKNWSVVKIDALDGVRLHLSTMWRTGSLYYQFSVIGYPPGLSAVRDTPRDRTLNEPAWTLEFLDEHGFKVFEYDVPLSRMARIVDSTGKGSALRINDQTQVDAETYRRASSWQVGWNFKAPNPIAPATAPRVAGEGTPGVTRTPSWRNVSLWRQLKRGMSKQQVRAILGEPGKVVELGFQSTWYYGYPVGGDVDFTSSGVVSSWSEP